MASIAEIRTKYPMYSDMSDEALSDALYSKHSDAYGDMTKEQFREKVGVNQARIDQAFDGSQDARVKLGDVMPYSELVRGPEDQTIEGTRDFDPNQGILGAIKRAMVLPGDVYSGKQQLYDASGEILPEVIEGATEFAGVFSPMSAGSKAISGLKQPIKALSRETEEANARIAAAEAKGIDLSSGQAVPAQKIQAAEQDILHGTAGPEAQQILQAQREVQQGQVDTALAGLRDDISPGVSETVGEAGGLIGEAVTQRASDLKRASQEAFGNVERSNAEIAAEALPALKERVFSKLEKFGANEGAAVAPDMPVVKRMFARISDLASLKNAPEGSVSGVQWGAVQNIRSQLVNLAKGGDGQAAALRTMRQGLDEWADEVVMKGLVSGDKQALSELKRARGLWKEYKGILNNPNLAVRKIAEGALDGSQIANLIVGAGQIGNKQAGASIVREIKKVLGADAAPISELKRGVLNRLFTDTAQGKTKTYGKLASDITRFTSKDAPELARELFGVEGLRALREFADVVRTLTPDALATNPSRTGFTIARKFGDVVRKNAAILGFAAGDLTGLIGGLAFSAGRNKLAVRQARQLSAPTQKTLPPATLKQLVPPTLNRFIVPTALTTGLSKGRNSLRKLGESRGRSYRP